MTTTTSPAAAPATTAPAPWLPITAGAITLVMWASAFVVIRHVAHDVSPGALGAGRLLVAALVVAPLVLRRGWVRPNRREWALLALGGVGWFGVYNLALNAGERHVDVAEGLAGLGVPPEAAAAVAEVYAEHGRQVAAELSEIVRTLVWPPFREAGGTAEQLREMVHRLKPLTVAGLVAAYEQAMDDSAAAYDEKARR